MPRTLHGSLIPMAIAFSLLSGCSDRVTAPSPTARSEVKVEGKKVDRRKDHALKDRHGGRQTLYLDDAAQMIHDSEGNERAVSATFYAKLRRDFARIASADAMYERLDTDADFRKCLRKAQAKGSGHRVRLARAKAGIAYPRGSLPGGARLSLAPIGPARLVDPSDPTFCQEVALGLYDATRDYFNARDAYHASLAMGVFSGFGVRDGDLSYDPMRALELVGAMTMEYMAMNFLNATIQAGIWGTWFNLGGCGGPNAPYGYTTAGGTGATGSTTLACHYEYVVIEASDDNGETWYVLYEGEALVCE